MPSHLSPDLYRLVLRGQLSPELLLEHAHRHLVEVCDACGTEYQVDQEEASAEPVFRVDDGGRPAPVRPRRPSLRLLERRLERWSRIQGERRKAKENLRHLRRHPPEEWETLVEEAQARFRSRAFAELLVHESERVLPKNPAEARRLAALVPAVLHWIPGVDQSPWAPALRRRARQAEARAALRKG